MSNIVFSYPSIAASLFATTSRKSRLNALVALGKECDRLLAVDPPDLDALDRLVIKYREANCLATSERLKVSLRFLR